MHNSLGNEAQQKAIQHGEGPMIVLAGPGSGKTFVITKRIQYLIEHYHVEPSEILVITFTRAAAIEMKQRFTSLCQALPVNFGTFHAVYYSILKDFYHYDSHSIITEKEKRQLLSKAIKTEQIDLKLHGELLDGLLSEISIAKNNRDIQAYSSDYLEPEVFHKLYDAYERLLELSEKVDFDDMVLKCHNLLCKRPDILEKWRNMFRYVLIDEFQDINLVQYEIIKMLSLPENNLFIVGDDDQSIYKFRGANPEIMNQFMKDYPNAQKTVLNINYRSTKNIITFAESVIKKNKMRLPKNIISNNEIGAEVMKIGYETREQEYDALLELLSKEKEDGTLHDCAIIFRTGHEITLLSKALAENGIPFQTKEIIKSIYDHAMLEDIKAYLRFAKGETSRSLFFRFMNKPMRYISRELIEEQVDLKHLANSYIGYDMKQCVLLLETQLKRLGEMPLYLGVHYIRKAMGYDEYLRSIAGNSEQKREELFQIADEIQHSVKGFKTIEEWEADLDIKREEFLNNIKKEQIEKNGVSLMTMHGSKGLEYKKVFIPNCNEGIIPHRKARKPEEIEEERRLFYVAVTRAKKELIIQYITGTKDNPSFPSRFLQ